MKKILFLLLFLFVAVGIWVYFNRNLLSPTSPLPTEETNQTSSKLSETSLVKIVSNTLPTAISPPTNKIEIAEPMNALTATNLEQWKTAIKGLTRLGGIQFHQDWIFEQQQPNRRGADRNSGIPIILSQNGKTITYTATFINLATKNGSDNDLLETELYSPNMNIEQTRQLGLQLCGMLQVDPKNFLAWCDKVGTNWLDQPLFADGNRQYSFHILQSFGKEKPWCINFMITPNP